MPPINGIIIRVSLLPNISDKAPTDKRPVTLPTPKSVIAVDMDAYDKLCMLIKYKGAKEVKTYNQVKWPIPIINAKIIL